MDQGAMIEAVGFAGWALVGFIAGMVVIAVVVAVLRGLGL